MITPSFAYERRLWRKGYELVAGLDEVGRGCFAGPVVSGCVVFPHSLSMNRFIDSSVRIDDSKKLTAKQRLVTNDWIKENSLAWGIGEASVSEINRLGMAKATNMAFRRAVASAGRRLHQVIEYLLIDAFYVPYVRGLPKHSCQLAVAKGDSKSFSIAAASVVAKVYRDQLMEKVGSRNPYKKYFWIDNKGYGTKAHREAILRHGICCYHRKQFVETYLSKM